MKGKNKFKSLIKAAKKAIVITLIGSFLGTAAGTIVGAVPVEAAVSRNDGVWLYPLPANAGTITDWAGCTQASYCTICGKYVDQTHINWGDKCHGATKYGHNGLDIGAGKGTNVLASADGIFFSTSDSSRGKWIILEHRLGNGYSYYSYYQHLNGMNQAFKCGDVVKAGDVIGYVGTTGSSTGNHLHFGIVYGASGKLDSGRNYSTVIGEMEKKGWILTSGNAEGRILVNPSSLYADGSKIKVSNGVAAPITAHAGSVTYTYNTANVTLSSKSSFTPATPTPISYSTPNVRVDGLTAPTGTLKKGKCFALYGVVKTDCGNITKVSAGVYDMNNNPVSGYCFSHGCNSSSYDIKKVINEEIIFNNLPEGNYKYIVNATAVNGDKRSDVQLANTTFTIQGNTPVQPVVQPTPEPTPQPTPQPTPEPVQPSEPTQPSEPAQPESVYVEPTPQPTPQPEPAKVEEPAAPAKPNVWVDGATAPSGYFKKGSCYGLRGTVKTDCGVITRVEGYVCDMQGNALRGFYSQYYPNSTSFDLRSTVNNDIIFNNLPEGDYTYDLMVTADNNGSTVRVLLINSAFNVRR